MSNPSIDIGRYLSLPRGTTLDYLALSRLALRYLPEDADENSQRAAKGLGAETERTTGELVERHIDQSAEERAEERDIDHADDGLWYVVRDRLEHWKVFARPGFARLARKQEPGGYDYAGSIATSERAAYVHRRVLGPRGVDFTQGSYTQQLERMITVWKVIEGEGYGEELRAMVGPAFYDGLVDCHARYVEMVERRAARDRRPRTSLSQLSARLRDALLRYNTTLVASLDPEDPSSVARFEAAMRPFDMFRVLAERSRRTPGSEEDEGEASIDVGELLAEEQSVEAEIDLAAKEAEG